MLVGAAASMMVFAVLFGLLVVAPLYVAFERKGLPVAVRLLLICVPASIPVTIALAARASAAGYTLSVDYAAIPSALLPSFAPSFACLLGGLVATINGAWRRASNTALAGVLVVAGASVQVLILYALIRFGATWQSS